MKFSNFVLTFSIFIISTLSVPPTAPIPKSFIQSRLQKTDLTSYRDTNGIVTLTDENNEIITEPLVRESSIVLFLTANSPEIGCKVCGDFKKIFDRTAKYWNDNINGISKNDLFFVELDFTNNQAFFKSLKINRVPHVWIIPNYNDLYKMLKFEQKLGEEEMFQEKNFKLKTSSHYVYAISEKSSTNEFSKYISQALLIDFEVDHDSSFLANLDSESIIGYSIIILAIIVTIKKKINDPNHTILEKLYQRRIWCGLSLLLTYLFISGYMFTVIRGVPFLARNDEGLFFFSGGSQYQIGIESFIIILLYAFIGLWMVLLIQVIPNIGPKELKEGQSKPIISISENGQYIAAILASFGLYYSYSYLTGVYLIKDGGYPFRLPTI